MTAIDVLYHLLTREAFVAALGGLASRVASGGHLLVSDVFCEVPRQSAPHVRHRPLGCYEETLGRDGLRLVDRERVFTLLDEPVPRLDRPVADRAARLAWRTLSAAIRLTPGPLRDGVGTAAVRALAPADRALGRRWGAGVTLELALFRRAG